MQTAILLALSILSIETLKPSFRRIVQIESGPAFSASGRVVCYDCDHDSLPEIMFQTGTIYPYDPRRIEFWEHQGWNRFKLVYADTGAYPEPNGITIGNVVPYDAGDIDGDGMTDIVCGNIEFYNPDSSRDIIMTLESPDSHGYPSLLSWYYPGVKNGVGTALAYIRHDFEHDGHNAIVGTMEGIGALIWKNACNDSNVLVWNTKYFGPMMAFGDFDCDGRNDMACSGFGVVIREDTGNYQYEEIWEDTVNAGGQDCWSTSDIDGDGRPEIYASYFSYPRKRMWLCMYEHDGNDHQFTRTLVDSLTFDGNDDWGRSSAGGDIDGDGIDECVWTTYDSVRVYKAYGNDDLRKVWDWRNDHHDTSGFNALTTTVYDVNGDGYNEFLLGGNSKVSIFEVDAVDLLAPNGGSCSVGDTVLIRWAVNTPPRCDSLSLFLRRDSLWHLSTIATGLPATDTLYRWVVPAGVPDTGRIIVMAYGPGHQYDMSDSVITFIGGGVVEGTHVPLRWALSVSPNPAHGAFTVRYDVPGLGAKAGTVPRSARTRGTVPVFALGIYDVDGRLVRSLSNNEVSPGRYEAKLPSGTLPAGIYFLRLDSPGFRSVKKAVVTR